MFRGLKSVSGPGRRASGFGRIRPSQPGRFRSPVSTRRGAFSLTHKTCGSAIELERLELSGRQLDELNLAGQVDSGFPQRAAESERVVAKRERDG
jgi:hypothetical protein